MIEIIKQKMLECKSIFEDSCQTDLFKEKTKNSNLSKDEIAFLYNEQEIRSSAFSKNFPAMMMRKNQAIAEFNKLKKEYELNVFEKTKVFLLCTNIDETKIKDELKNKKCVFFNHLDLSKKIAHFLMPAIRSGDCINGHLIYLLNDILKTAEEEIGVDSLMTPEIELRQDCMVSIRNIEDLIIAIEHMLKTQLFPSKEIPEGYFLQALFNKVQYSNSFEDLSIDPVLNCVIKVPYVNDFLTNEYKRFFSNDVKVITIEKDSELRDFCNKFENIKIEDEIIESEKAKRKYIKKTV